MSRAAVTLYGIAACDACRRARRWLDVHGIAHRFHDLRADGVPAARLAAWVAELGWERVLNRRSTTWRGLPEASRAHLDAASALALMRTHPTLIRRPVLDLGARCHVGFAEPDYVRLLSGARGLRE